jgi:hypothetical protein
LPLQIDLGGVVDRHRAVVLHDDVRRVDLVHRKSSEVVISINGAVEVTLPSRTPSALIATAAWVSLWVSTPMTMMISPHRVVRSEC